MGTRNYYSLKTVNKYYKISKDVHEMKINVSPKAKLVDKITVSDVRWMILDIAIIISHDIFPDEFFMSFESISAVAAYMYEHPDTWHSYYLLTQLHEPGMVSEPHEKLCEKYLGYNNQDKLRVLLKETSIICKEYADKIKEVEEENTKKELNSLFDFIDNNIIIRSEDFGDHYGFLTDDAIKSMMKCIVYFMVYTNSLRNFTLAPKSIGLAAEQMHIEYIANPLLIKHYIEEIKKDKRDLPPDFYEHYKIVMDIESTQDKYCLDKIEILLIAISTICRRM